MPRAYDRNQLAVDRNPLQGLEVELSRLPKMQPIDPAWLWEQFLIQIGELTGLDFSSGQAFVDSVIDLIQDAIADFSEFVDNVIKVIVQAFTGQPNGTAANLTTWANDTLNSIATSLGLTSSYIGSGGNLVPNPGFENTTAFYGSTNFVTEQKRSGTRSLRLVAGGTTAPDYFVVNNNTGKVQFGVSPGDTFSVEFWVYGKAGNKGGGNISLTFRVFDTAGTAYATPTVSVANTTALIGKWTKVTGTITIPNDGKAARAEAFVQAGAAGALLPDGETVYFDDVVIKETTAVTALESIVATTQQVNQAIATAVTDFITTGNAQNLVTAAVAGLASAQDVSLAIAKEIDRIISAITGINNGTFAQLAQWSNNTVNQIAAALGLTSSYIQGGANIIPNPDFENLNFLGSGSYSTDQKRSGTRSLKLTGANAWVIHHVLVDNVKILDLPVSPKDTFVAEMWVYGGTGNVGGGTVQFVMQLFDAAGAHLGYTTVNANATTALKGKWTRVLGTFRVEQADAAKARIFIQLSNTVPPTDVYYFDSVGVKETTAVSALEAITQTAQQVQAAINAAVQGFIDETGAQGLIDAATAGLASTQQVNQAIANGIKDLITTGNAQNLINAAVAGLQNAQQVAAAIGAGINQIIETVTGNAEATLAELGEWATNLVNEAAAALGLTSSYIGSGSNLVPNPNFENLSFYGSTNFVTDVKRNGTRSLKLAATTPNADYFVVCDNVGAKNLHCHGDDVFDCEFWVYGGAANVGGGLIQLLFTPFNEAGAALPAQVVSVNNTTALKGQWTRVAGKVTMPAGTIYTTVRLRLTAAMPATEVLYFDDVVVREVTLANNVFENLGQVIANFFSGWFGKPTDNLTPEEVLATSQAIAQAITSLQEQIDAWNTGNSGTNFSGNSEAFPFVNALNGALPAVFSAWYSNASQGTYVVSNGRVKFAANATGGRTAKARYKDKGTLTDFQRVGATFAGQPGLFPPSYNYLYGRMNTADNNTANSYVYAKLGQAIAHIGYCLAGVETDISTHTDFRFKSNATYWLEVGTGTNLPQTFRLWENGKVLYTVVDGTAKAPLGPANRHTGFGATTGALTAPADVTAFYFHDNVPAQVRGSGYRASRIVSTAAGIAASAGSNLFPNGYYGKEDYRTPDYTYTATGNAVTVTAAGWYYVNIVQNADGKIGLGAAHRMAAEVRVNNTVVQRGQIVTSNTSTDLRPFAGSFIIYCKSGDVIQPGYYSLTSYALAALNAGASGGYGLTSTGDGATTYWTVNFLGNQKPVTDPGTVTRYSGPIDEFDDKETE